MKRVFVFAATILIMISSAAIADVKVDKIRKHVDTSIKKWASNPVIINAIKTQNNKHKSISQKEIDRLDKQWRAEAKSSPGQLVKSVLRNELSKYLASIKHESKGLYTEIFVMDDKGLNVGTSDVTSDYWQGDEAKWKETFKKGANAVHIGKVELDESTRQYQSQASIPIVDPKSKKVIGAITVGINVDELK